MRLTRQQRAFYRELQEKGFVEHRTQFGRSQRNRCGWKLVELGHAVFDFGPRGSMLQTQGFLLPSDTQR
jgi:hypothetical protein